LILIYDYTTTRFLRTDSGELFVLQDTENVAKRLKHNTRWIDTEDMGVIDMAYVYVENELAEQEGRPIIELEEKIAI
jgi:hypothetical protein